MKSGLRIEIYLGNTPYDKLFVLPDLRAEE